MPAGAAEGTPQVVSDTMRAPAAQPTKTITVGSGPTRALDGKNETELALKDRNGSGPKHALDGKKKVAFALKERIEVCGFQESRSAHRWLLLCLTSAT